MNLADVFAKYPDTDKGGPGAIHSYDEVLDSLFTDRRLSVRRVLEVGVRGGGSLLSWRDYFENADVIVGVDNGSEAGFWTPTADRIVVVRADSTKPETLHRVGVEYGPFDFVCDDGLHHPYSQVATFAALRPFLAPGGIFCVEDVEDISFATKMAELFGGEVFDRRELKQRHDDILWVYRN